MHAHGIPREQPREKRKKHNFCDLFLYFVATLINEMSWHISGPRMVNGECGAVARHSFNIFDVCLPFGLISIQFVVESEIQQREWHPTSRQNGLHCIVPPTFGLDI